MKNKLSCKYIQYTGCGFKEIDGAEIYSNYVLQYCSYRPREMSSKKPVSRLRQVIPVKKRVSDIVFALTKAFMYICTCTIHVIEKWKKLSFYFITCNTGLLKSDFLHNFCFR